MICEMSLTATMTANQDWIQRICSVSVLVIPSTLVRNAVCNADSTSPSNPWTSRIGNLFLRNNGDFLRCVCDFCQRDYVNFKSFDFHKLQQWSWGWHHNRTRNWVWLPKLWNSPCRSLLASLPRLRSQKIPSHSCLPWLQRLPTLLSTNLSWCHSMKSGPAVACNSPLDETSSPKCASVLEW